MQRSQPYLDEHPEPLVLSLPLLDQTVGLGLVGREDRAGMAEALASRTIKLQTRERGGKRVK